MEKDGRIRLARAFCSARDRNVPVLRREPFDLGTAPATAELPELVSCLDYGVRCTGWLCPHFSLPTLPPEELLTEATEAERRRKRRAVADGRAILERALREGRSIPAGTRAARDGDRTPHRATGRDPSDDPRSTA